MPTNLKLLVCAAIFCCGCPLGTPRDHYRPPGHQDTTIAVSPSDDAILFNAVGEGGRDLYLLDLTSMKVTRVAATEYYETAASFSPDGQWIVYSAGWSGDRADHLFLMKRDGSSKTKLTNGDANDTSGRFSPDGTTIVFARDKTYNWGGLAANWELGGVICVIDADGKNFRQLTADGEYACQPYFSADGARVIYSTIDGSKSVDVEGSSAPKSLTCPMGIIPSFDGKFIVYSKGKFSPDCKIYVANADGSSERCLTLQIGGCFHPVFAHAGDHIWFLQLEWPDGPTGEPKSSLWEVTFDGSKIKKLTDLSLFDDPLKWKPSK